MAAELAELWGVADVDMLMRSMTPGQLDFWVAKNEISPIGIRGVESLLAVLGAAMLSTDKAEVTPDQVKKACVVCGGIWLPLDLESKKPATADQVAAMLKMAGA